MVKKVYCRNVKHKTNKANSKLKFKEIFFDTIMNICNEGSKQNLQSHNIYKEDQERDDPSTNDIWVYYSIVSRLSLIKLN